MKSSSHVAQHALCARPDFYILIVLYETLFDTWKKNIIWLVQILFKLATDARRIGQFDSRSNSKKLCSDTLFLFIYNEEYMKLS